MEQNETGCQAPQSPVLCVNNCGFFGTAATMNMCSKCYKDTVLNQEQANFAAASIQSIVNGTNSSTKDPVIALTTEPQTAPSDVIVPQTSSSSPAIEKTEQVKEGPKRCWTCRKRVGLTGFNCRCGSLFCSVHRYSDKHECPFDYRSAGQEAIAKANPVVKAEKLDKVSEHTHFILPEYLMQKDQMQTLEEAKDVLKKAGVDDDDMAALERQLLPTANDATAKDAVRKVGFVSAGVQNAVEATTNKEDIELPEESDSEDDEKVEIAQKDVPTAVFGGLVRKRDESDGDLEGVDSAKDKDEPLGALERIKRMRQAAV